MKNIGVILAGNGFLDGSETREAVLTLLAIDKLGANSVIMAPDIDQHHTVDHLTGNETKDTRNVLVESARIARGNIKNIKDVLIDDLDALIMPGGFGVAKNLSNFAFKGPEAEVIREVSELILAVNAKKMPIGVICISPAVLSLLLGEKGLEVTIGSDKETAETIERRGGKHIDRAVNEIYYDDKLKVVSTPAYMYGDAKIKEIYEGIEKLVQKVIDLLE